MFEIELKDAKVFKNSIEAVGTLIDEGLFDISSEGIKLRAMDPSQIAMVDFNLPRSAFSKYDLKDEVKIGLNIEDISKVMSRMRGSETLTLKLEDSKLVMIFMGDTKRRFVLPLLDLGSSVPNEPKIEYNANIKISGSVLKEGLKDAALISSHVVLNASPDSFLIQANGDKGEVKIESGKDEDAIVDYKVTDTTRSMFPLEYLNDLLKACDNSSIVSINLKTDAPLRVNYSIGDANLTYFLAPRIETA